jgi:hypothetical protein
MRRTRAPAPLDPRRLADRELAAAAGAGRRRAAPATRCRPVALEDRRQPAAQPGADCAAAAAAGGLDRAAVPLAWTLVVVGIVLVPPLLGSVLQLLRKPREATLRQHLARPRSRPRRNGRRPGSRWPACPRSLRSADAWCARPGACWSRGGGCSNGARPGTRPAARPGLLSITSIDVDGAGGRARDRRVPGRSARPSVLGLAAPILLLWLAAPGSPGG